MQPSILWRQINGKNVKCLPTGKIKESKISMKYKRKKSRLGYRHSIILLGFLGNLVLYVMRLTFNLSLFRMTPRSLILPRGNYTECQLNDSVTPIDGQNMEMFNWTGTERTHLLGSFYYGYILSQILSGYLAAYYGAKRLFAAGVTLSALLTFLLPTAARFGIAALFCVRILTGIAQGMSIPVLSTIFGRWIPPLERTMLLAFAACGIPIGMAFIFPVSAAFAEAYGWPSAFYFTGAVGSVFVIPWLLLVFDSPEEHPWITGMEKSYIISSIGAPAMGVKPSRVPWKSMAQSGPFWALVICCWCSDYGSFMLMNVMPLYLQGYLGKSLSTTANYMVLPYLLMSIVILALSPWANHLISKDKSSRTVVRKLSTAMGTFIPGVLLIGLSFQQCSFPTAMGLMTLTVGFTGFSTFGFRVNFNDISPSHAGLLWGIGNTFGTITGVVVPWVTRVHIVNGQTSSNWRSVILIGAIHYLLGGLCYVLLGSGEQQPWDHTDKAFAKERTAPESLWERLKKEGRDMFPGPRTRKSVPPWIPPSSMALLTPETAKRQDIRRRSSIVPPGKRSVVHRKSVA